MNFKIQSLRYHPSHCRIVGHDPHLGGREYRLQDGYNMYPCFRCSLPIGKLDLHCWCDGEAFTRIEVLHYERV